MLALSAWGDGAHCTLVRILMSAISAVHGSEMMKAAIAQSGTCKARYPTCARCAGHNSCRRQPFNPFLFLLSSSMML